MKNYLLWISILLSVWAFLMIYMVTESRWTESGEFCEWYGCNIYNPKGDRVSPTPSFQPFLTQ